MPTLVTKNMNKHEAFNSKLKCVFSLCIYCVMLEIYLHQNTYNNKYIYNNTYNKIFHAGKVVHGVAVLVDQACETKFESPAPTRRSLAMLAPGPTV